MRDVRRPKASYPGRDFDHESILVSWGETAKGNSGLCRICDITTLTAMRQIAFGWSSLQPAGETVSIEKEFLEVASNISTPLALAGLFAAILFLILRQVVAKDIFPAVAKSASARLIQRTITYLFVLSLVAMILGFIGYLVVQIVSRNGSQLPEWTTISVPSGMDLGATIKMFAEMDDAVVSFGAGCTESIQNLHVEPGTLRARDTAALIEQLAHRLESPVSVTLRAHKNLDRGIYEISCAK